MKIESQTNIVTNFKNQFSDITGSTKTPHHASTLASGKKGSEKGSFLMAIKKTLFGFLAIISCFFCCFPCRKGFSIMASIKKKKDIQADEALMRSQYPKNCTLKSFSKSIQKEVKALRDEHPHLSEPEALKQVIEREKANCYKQFIEYAKYLPKITLIKEFIRFNDQDQITLFGTPDYAKQLEYKALSVLGKKIEEHRPRSWFKKHVAPLVMTNDMYARLAKNYLWDVLLDSRIQKEAGKLILSSLDAIKAETFR